MENFRILADVVLAAILLEAVKTVLGPKSLVERLMEGLKQMKQKRKRRSQRSQSNSSHLDRNRVIHRRKTL